MLFRQSVVNPNLAREGPEAGRMKAPEQSGQNNRAGATGAEGRHRGDGEAPPAATAGRETGIGTVRPDPMQTA